MEGVGIFYEHHEHRDSLASIRPYNNHILMANFLAPKINFTYSTTDVVDE